MFSKACEYGIRAMIFVALKSKKKEKVNISDIAVAAESPTAFTAKVLQKLVKGNILSSTKGPHGGFYISEEAIRKTTLSDIVTAIDGDSIYKGCGLGLKECNALQPCPLHDKFTQVRNELHSMLKTTSLDDLATQLENGTGFLKS